MKYKEKFVSEDSYKPVFEADKKEKRETNANIKPGSVVSFKLGAQYYGGRELPTYALNQKWFAGETEGDFIRIGTNIQKTSMGLGKVRKKDVILEDKKENPVKHYKVRITSLINVREDAGTQFKRTGYLAKNAIVTIIAEKEDYMGQLWGKVKELNNWIVLKFTERIEPVKVPVEVKVTTEEPKIEEEPIVEEVEIEEL